MKAPLNRVINNADLNSKSVKNKTVETSSNIVDDVTQGAANTIRPYDLQATHSQTLSNKKFSKLVEDIRTNGI